MNKDSTDFMIEEFGVIANAYFKLQEELTNWFKFYLSFIAIPLTATGIILQISNDSGESIPTLITLPDLVSGLLIIIGILGVFVLFSIVSTRNEMLMYARTINKIRGYFADLDLSNNDEVKLYSYLVLPYSDKFPQFFEQKRTVYFMSFMIGLINGVIFGLGVINLINLDTISIPLPYAILAAIVILSVIFHFVAYKSSANNREKEWNAEDSLIPSYRQGVKKIQND